MGLVLVVAFGAVVVRLVDVQVLSAERYADVGRTQRLRSVVLPAQRGAIVDRNGAELAVSVRRPTVWADPRAVDDPAATAFALAPVLGRDPTELRDLLTGDAAFAYVARKVDDETGRAVAALELPGIGIYDEADRLEPAGTVAGPVLGGVGIDGDGLSGLEQQYDAVLAGTPGERVVERDPAGREIAGGAEREVSPVRGSELVLTLDRDLQYATEEILGRHVAEAGARSGVAVIMDPTTGEVLAMAAMTGRPGAAAAPSSYNRALVDVYEPGSVAKIVPMAGALEEGAVGPEQVFTVPDRIEVAGSEFSDFAPHPTESLTSRRILAESSNVGTIQVARALGPDRLARYLGAFGLGQPTGLAFPGESTGLVPERGTWSGTSLATLALGQGVAVNAVQMLGAYNAVANGGVLVTPRLVREVVAPDGTSRPLDDGAGRPVVSEATARLVADMLAEVVRDGTGRGAAIDGYAVAGKTGTARKVVEGVSGYKDGAYVASFAGFFPAEHPRVSMIVVLDEPTPYTGGAAAAPAFADLARFTARHLQVPGSAPPEPATGAATLAASPTGP